MERLLNTIAYPGIALLLLCFVSTAGARIITVDDDAAADFNNIQAAIDAASNGDTVVVEEGTYFENINFRGKNIVLTSTDPNDPNVVAATIIDGQEKNAVATFNRGEDANCILEGFTITNGGMCGNLESAGIFCYNSSPTIRYNLITDNNWSGEWGGGIYCGGGSSPLIVQNTIKNNYSEFSGGIDCWDDSSPIITGNIIMHNRADSGMGAIHVAYSHPIIQNNLIALNSGAGIGIYASSSPTVIANNTIVDTSPSGYEYAGIRVYGSVAPIIRNCILWRNGDELKGCTATYSCVKGNDTDGKNNDDGDFNISTDPLFADSNSVDYHLKSQAGRWDANEGRWTIDEVTSPCIDAGDPMTAIGREPFPNGGRINMGAYGGTAEASKSYFGKPPCETIVAGDINGDCAVNFLDFHLMALRWLTNGNL